jgi:hypothetical protein
MTPVKSANKMRSYEEFASSLRNFDSWVGDAVPGGSDLDFICERRGHFLVLEGKPMEGSGVNVPFGQYLMLDALAASERFVVYLIGEEGDTLWRLRVGDTAPVRKRTAPVWYPRDRFERTDKDGLRSMLRAWWASH